MYNPNMPGGGPSTIWQQNYAGTGFGDALRHHQGLPQQNRDQQPRYEDRPLLPQYRPPTREEKRAWRRLRWLRLIDPVLLLGLFATFGWWAEGTRYISPPLFVLVLIPAIAITNQVVKHRLKKTYGM
jgi:hypothetical protein